MSTSADSSVGYPGVPVEPTPAPAKGSKVVAVAESIISRPEAAAQTLERAAQAGGQDPNVLYMLAMAYKRQGKTNEARTALRKIKEPDGNVLLQMGLLSLQEQNLAQAEGEFLKALELDPTSYETSYNLILTQLTLGKADACLEQLPRTIELAENPEEQQFLKVLQALLKASRSDPSNALFNPALAELTEAEEQRLLDVVSSLGELDTALHLLQALLEVRPASANVREAYLEVVLVKAKWLVDRCKWTEAEQLLRPMTRERSSRTSITVSLLNLLGCCACMTQDFDSAIRSFSAASKLANDDPRLQQNLALAYELRGDLPQADPHWNRFFDLLDFDLPEGDLPQPADLANYREELLYTALNRLATQYSDRERWSSAISYVQRAVRRRPDDAEALEELFHLFNRAKRPHDAHRTLDQLRRLRPDDPQLELYELDMIEVRGLNEIERLLTEIDRILKRHPGDARVEERAVTMVGSVIPLMGNLCDQLTDQMSKVIDQVRHLPNYQINWSAVREVMRDLLREFQKLRRITGKCLPLVNTEEHKRIVRDLADHIDKKMEACRSMGA